MNRQTNNRVTGSLLVGALVLTGALAAVSCTDKRHDCAWLANCETSAAAGQSGAAGSASSSSNSAGRAAGGVAGSTTGADLGGAGQSTSSSTDGPIAGVGGAPPMPCAGLCTDPKAPQCNEATQSCVECLSDEHCNYLKPRCDATNTCVECVDNDDVCPWIDPNRPRCDRDSRTCVPCLDDGDCRNPASPRCDLDAKTCVSCLQNSDCTSDVNPRCDTKSHACSTCQTDDDCTLFADKPICLAGASGQPNRCVACTLQNEKTCVRDGIERSCNPITNACTSTRKGSVTTCKPCVADSECVGGNVEPQTARCVPMTFGATRAAHGAYCLQVETTCAEPYGVSIRATSLSGVPSAMYCGLDQTTTTCEAVLDMLSGKTCQADAACGARPITTTPILGNAGQGNAGQGNTGQGNAGQGNSGQSNAGQGGAGQGGASQAGAGIGSGSSGAAGQTNVDYGGLCRPKNNASTQRVCTIPCSIDTQCPSTHSCESPYNYCMMKVDG